MEHGVGQVDHHVGVEHGAAQQVLVGARNAAGHEAPAGLGETHQLGTGPFGQQVQPHFVGGRLGLPQSSRAFVAQHRVPAAVAHQGDHRFDDGRLGDHVGLRGAHRPVAQVGLDENPVAGADEAGKRLFDQGQCPLDGLPEGLRLVGGVANQGDDGCLHGGLILEGSLQRSMPGFSFKSLVTNHYR